GGGLEVSRAAGARARGDDAGDPGHTGGTPKKPPSGSGAFASASSRDRQGAGSSSARTLTRSSGCEVGGTPSRSSSDTLPTASRIALSCPRKRSSSSSVSASRASLATCSTSSRLISTSTILPKWKGPLSGALEQVPKGKL